MHEQGKPDSLNLHFCYFIYREKLGLQKGLHSCFKNPDTHSQIVFQILFTLLRGECETFAADLLKVKCTSVLTGMAA